MDRHDGRDIMDDVTESELLEIESGFWRASGDRRAYESDLSADAIHVFPGWGVAEREDVLAAVDEAEPWEHFKLKDVRMVDLGQDAVALVYVATANRAGKAPYVAAMMTVYRREDSSLRLVLHQQTPL
jgi:hypothetical protein